MMLPQDSHPKQAILRIENIDREAERLAAMQFGRLCTEGYVTFEQLTAADDSISRMVMTLALVLKMAFAPLHTDPIDS